MASCPAFFPFLSFLVTLTLPTALSRFLSHHSLSLLCNPSLHCTCTMKLRSTIFPLTLILLLSFPYMAPCCPSLGIVNSLIPPFWDTMFVITGNLIGIHIAAFAALDYQVFMTPRCPSAYWHPSYFFPQVHIPIIVNSIVQAYSFPESAVMR